MALQHETTFFKSARMRVSVLKVLDPPKNVPYFILTELQEDTDNFEESQINVSITDGVHFWRKEGEKSHKRVS